MEKLRKLYDGYGNVLLGLVAFLLITLTLFTGDDIGLSDNGDFSRVIRASSITRTGVQSRFVYVSGYEMELIGDGGWQQLKNLLFSAENVDRYPSIHLLFVRMSTAGNFLFNKLIGADPGLYRLGVLGLLYTLCYSVAISRLFSTFRIRKRTVDICCKALALVVLCDTGYTAYFNSFYSEPVQIIGFILMLAGCLRIITVPKPGVRDVVYLALAALVYGWAKFANLPVALLVILIFSVVAFLKNRQASVFPVMAVSAAAVLSLFLLIPDWMSFETNYNAVFFGALYDTDEEQQREYLQALGLPAEYTELAETNAYVKRVQPTLLSAEFEESFGHISKTRLLFFYGRHPKQLIKLTDIAIKNSGFLRPYYLSNYSGAHPRFTQTHRFSLWSDLRVQLGFDGALANALLVLLFCGMFLLLYKRSARGEKWKLQTVLVILCVTGFLLYSLVVPVISNGAGDVSKHMFAYAQMMDALFFAVLFMAAALCTTVTRRRIPFAAAGGVLAILIVSAAPFFRFTANLSAAGTTYDAPEAGAYIQLGSMNGESLVWQAVSEENGVLELLCGGSVGERVFSAEGEFGSNYWPDSALREWLNGEFLNAFTDEEKALIAGPDAKNRFLLSGEYENKAAGGTNDFYCMHIPALAANGYKNAIYAQTEDLVYLPDIAVVSSLSAQQSIRLAGSYWLETPYYSNGSMQRVVFPDGYIYFRDACETAAVRPMVRIPVLTVSSGSGSRKDPFILQIP